MGGWIKADKCPYCEGKLVLQEHYAFTYDSIIKNDGTPSKRRRKSVSGPIDCTTVYCPKCESYWEENEVDARDVVCIFHSEF